MALGRAQRGSGAGGRMSEGARRRLTGGSMLGAGVLLAVALIGMVNYFGWKYHVRGDWTSSGLYTLSQRSQQVLDDIPEAVDVVVFMRPGDQLYEPVQELLARYDAASPKIRVRTVDPERNVAQAQALVEQYQLTHGNVVVFQSGEERRVIEAADLAEYDYSGMQFGQGPQMTGFKGEQMFTGALLELAEGRKPRVLFTTGHGEASLDDQSPTGLSQLQELLGQDNFELEEWRSLGKENVPEDVDLIVVAGPRSGFTPPELDLLGRFVGRGGRMIVLLEPLLPDQAVTETGLEEWLAGYGVRVGRDIVVDPANQVPFFGAESFFINSYGEHPVTQALSDAGVPVIVSLARSVTTEGGGAGYEVTQLLQTGAEGWAETGLDDLTAVEQGDQDVAGPVSLAVAVTAAPEPTDAAGEAGGEETSAEAGEDASSESGVRLVVVGDSDLLTNGQIGNAGNPTFALNAINWLVERQQLLGIPPKEPEQVRLTLTRGQLQRLFWLVIVGLPLAAVAAGAVVYVRRRR